MSFSLNWPNQLPPIYLLADHELPPHAGALAYPGSTSSERVLKRIEPIDSGLAIGLREIADKPWLRSISTPKASDNQQ